jgi:hypothetical protein
VRNDTTRFTQRVVTQRLPNKPEALRRDLAAQMADKCQGMFIWVNLQKDELTRCLNRKTARSWSWRCRRCRNWTAILQSSNDRRSRALATLRWALYALRLITVRKVADALPINVDESAYELPLDGLPDALDRDYVDNKIVNPCHALIKVRRQSSASAAPDDGASVLDCGRDVIQLVHFSVREFLLAVMLPQPGCDISLAPFIDEKLHHTHLADVCLRYLQFPNVWVDEGGERSLRPFTDYAAGNWHEHVAAGDTSRRNLLESVNHFFWPGNHQCIAWRDYVNPQKPSKEDTVTPSPLSTMYFAAVYGLVSTIEFLHSL